MATTKHTKGTWDASGNGVHVGHRCVATTHMEPLSQRHADARLIAAAPDLLESARAALDDLDNADWRSNYEGTRNALRAAIAKAEGK